MTSVAVFEAEPGRAVASAPRMTPLKRRLRPLDRGAMFISDAGKMAGKPGPVLGAGERAVDAGAADLERSRRLGGGRRRRARR